MNHSYQDIYDWLSKQNPKATNSIASAGAAFCASLDDALRQFKLEIASAMGRDDFEKVDLLNSYCKRLYSLGEMMMEIIPGVQANAKPAPAAAERVERTERIDYAQYQVDPTKPHSIDEDFTNTKICACQFCGRFVPVSSWRDALVAVCAYAAEKNPSLVQSFPGDPDFTGKKRSYFGREAVVMNGMVYNMNIPGTDIYVWVNINANQTASLIKRVMRKIGSQDIQVYLRADYSPIHGANKD